MTKLLKNIDIILIAIGTLVVVYTQRSDDINIMILVFGIACVMFGLMRLSSRIPSKKQDDSFLKQNDE